MGCVPRNIALTTFHTFQYVFFFFISKYFLRFPHRFFFFDPWVISVLGSLQKLNFPDIFLSLISTFIPLWPDNILCIISIIFNLLRLILWPRIWSVLINIHMHLRWMCILQLLNEMFYKRHSRQVCWYFCSDLLNPGGFSVFLSY